MTTDTTDAPKAADKPKPWQATLDPQDVQHPRIVGPLVLGLDVSKYQAKPDWAAIAGAGYAFAFLRVADGLKHLDDTYAPNLEQARGAGLLVGPYLFWRANRDALEQAQLLAEAYLLGAGQGPMLPPVIDAEAESDMDLPAAEVRAALLATIAEVQRLCGRVVVYTAAGWWETHCRGLDLPGVDLWVAHYQTDVPMVPSTWRREGFRFWQYTDKGKVPGVKGGVDLNLFQGTREELRDYADGVTRTEPSEHTIAPPAP